MNVFESEQDLYQILNDVDDLKILKTENFGEKIVIGDDDFFNLVIPLKENNEERYIITEDGFYSLVEEIGIKKKLVDALLAEDKSKETLLTLLNMFVGKTCFSFFVKTIDGKNFIVATLPDGFQRYSLKEEMESMLNKLKERGFNKFLFVEPEIDLFDGFEIGVLDSEKVTYLNRDGDLIDIKEGEEVPQGVDCYMRGIRLRLPIVKNKKPEFQCFNYISNEDIGWLSETVVKKKPKDEKTLDEWLAESFCLAHTKYGAYDLVFAKEKMNEKINERNHFKFISKMLKKAHIDQKAAEEYFSCETMMDFAKKIMKVADISKGMKSRKAQETAGHIIRHNEICSICEQEIEDLE